MMRGWTDGRSWRAGGARTQRSGGGPLAPIAGAAWRSAVRRLVERSSTQRPSGSLDRFRARWNAPATDAHDAVDTPADRRRPDRRAAVLRGLPTPQRLEARERAAPLQRDGRQGFRHMASRPRGRGSAGSRREPDLGASAGRGVRPGRLPASAARRVWPIAFRFGYAPPNSELRLGRKSLERFLWRDLPRATDVKLAEKIEIVAALARFLRVVPDNPTAGSFAATCESPRTAEAMIRV